MNRPRCGLTRHTDLHHTATSVTRRLSIPLFLILSLTLGACKFLGDDNSRDDLLIADLLAAPTSVAVGSTTYTLSTALWRDFMPISPPGGKPMNAVFRVHSSDSSAVPLTVEAAWLVNDDKLWAISTLRESESAPAGVLEVSATGGPKWGIDKRVEAIVRLRDPGGDTRLLRVPDQAIFATY